MRYKHVLCIYPYKEELKTVGFLPPIGLEYVAMAITLAFMVGVLQLIMGVVRLGALVNFISHSVVVGFTAGAACLIAALYPAIIAARLDPAQVFQRSG